MRKVDAAKERIDKMISQEQHSGPLSEGEERDDDYTSSRKDYDGKWNKDDGPQSSTTEKA